ncbi:MAG: lipoprotein [Oxalobacteraceae bacterium]
MKSFFSLSRFAAIAVVATLLAACGQKGPLYMQAKPASTPVATPATTPASTPASTAIPVTQ